MGVQHPIPLSLFAGDQVLLCRRACTGMGGGPRQAWIARADLGKEGGLTSALAAHETFDTRGTAVTSRQRSGQARPALREQRGKEHCDRITFHNFELPPGCPGTLRHPKHGGKTHATRSELGRFMLVDGPRSMVTNAALKTAKIWETPRPRGYFYATVAEK